MPNACAMASSVPANSYPWQNLCHLGGFTQEASFLPLYIIYEIQFIFKYSSYMSTDRSRIVKCVGLNVTQTKQKY